MSESDKTNIQPKPSTPEETVGEKKVDISRYFDNASYTIFDEIVSPKKDDFFDTSRSSTVTDFDLASSANDFLKLDDHSSTNTHDVHRDIWIPSDQTKKVLCAIATSTAGTNFVDKENLTMPGLTINGDLSDQIKNTAIHFLGEEENIHRNILTASDVTQDERGLRKLIQVGCYKAAVNLSGRLLAVYAQGYGKINQPSKHTPHSLQLWYTRLALLAKLRQIDILENESKPFGNLDKPDMYFTFYPELYGTRPGSMATFAFRLLLAEVPLYCGKPKQALDNLHKILATVEQIISNFNIDLSGDGTRIKLSLIQKEDAIRLWKARKSRIFISVANCAVAIKNYVLGIETLEKLCESTDWTFEQLDAIKSSIGRIHLFLGDVSAAEKLLINRDNSDVVTVRKLIDKGLMAVAQNSFQEAYNYFQHACSLDPTNVALTNNMAVCLLYTGQLKAAVHLYENAISKDPLKTLQEPILLNMCTSYELHTTHCKQSKLYLLRQLNRYKGDAMDIQCLKLAM